MPHPFKPASFSIFSFPRSAWERASRRSASSPILVSLLFFAGVASPATAQDTPPRSLDPRVKIELFAEHPQIVTPTGIDVDSKGRVWAVESNTHFPPEGYQGHPTDRILVMSDTDGDGKADRIVVFTDGLKHTMSVAVRPLWLSPPSQGGGRGGEVDGKSAPKAPATNPGAGTDQRVGPPGSPKNSVYIATRREISLFHDDDGDDKADRREQIVHLETKGDYPHNGLAGFAFDALGWMYFGFGENLGADYKIIGSDGTTLSGGGEGGSVCRCRPDGTKLERWATGFWNPHASCFDAFGRLFTVDNDPDSRPPCRLMHIIRGGDYGYRFRNGRAGLHPFTSWNGEIPGTLPMVAGTGEAPSGILCYESDGLPEEYIGNLFVTSWGDHRIDRFQLKPRGASFTSLAEPLIVGGENFRPVGIACAPDGSLYFTDWVKRDYTLHSQGRVWRITPAKRERKNFVDASTVSSRPVEEQLQLLIESKRIDVRRMAATTLRQSPTGRKALISTDTQPQASTRARLEALRALALVPAEVEKLDVFRILGSGVWKSLGTKRGSIVATEYIQLLGADTPQVPQTGKPILHRMAMKNDLALIGLTLVFVLEEQLKLATPDWSDPVFPLTALEFLIIPADDDDDTKKVVHAVASIAENGDAFIFSGAINAIQNTFAFLEEMGEWYVAERQVTKEDVAESKALLARLISTQFDVRANPSPRGRLAFLLGYRRRFPQDIDAPRGALLDPDQTIRRAAVQWAAEEHLKELRPQVAAILDDPQITADLFLATLAALEMLDGVPPAEFDKTPPGKYVLPLVRDAKRTPTLRALALRLVDPADPTVDGALLAELLKSEDATLLLETVRTLQSSPAEQAAVLLQSIAANEKQDVTLRAEAIVGLARGNARGELPAETRRLLLSLVNGDDSVLRTEALRSLRGFVATDRKVQEAVERLGMTPGGARGALAEEIALALTKEPAGGHRPIGWSRPLATADLNGGDAAAGRRVFFHTKSAGCYKCHTVNGRGGHVGPELSTIGRSHNREKLIDSIYEPGKEIAPQYVTWSFETTDGKVHAGMIVHENEGKTIVGDAEGKLTELKTIDIVTRVAQQKSVMPEKLPEQMTRQEFRDLIAFLESLK